MSACKEKTLIEIEQEAQLLMVMSGFRVDIESARDRVCDSSGWVDYQHCLKCKGFRGVE